MADIVDTLRNSNGDRVFPIAGGMIADSITTSMLKDDSVTSDKIDWTTVLYTKTDSSNRTAIVFGDGTMICTRLISITNLNINTAWGSLYYGKNPDYYTFSPASAPDFVSMPIVTITPTANGTRSFWMGAWANSDPSNVNASNRWAIPLESIMFLRPTAQTSVSLKLHVIAVGRWKA